MSIILKAIHSWIENQIFSRLKSPKTRSELIQFALKVASTKIFNSSSFSSSKRKRRNRNEKREYNQRSHLGKRNRVN